MRWSIVVPFVVALSSSDATRSHAQECYVGVYADAQGTISLLHPMEVTIFEFYVVARPPDDVRSFSYGLSGPGLGVSLFLIRSWWGPQGLGPHLPSPAGETVDLGECVSGQDGDAIVVARYQALISADFPFGELCIAGVSPESNSVPYESCDGTSHPCAIATCLYLEEVFSTNSPSWGAVKSLYQ